MRYLLQLLFWFVFLAGCTNNDTVQCNAGGLAVNGTCNYCTVGTPETSDTAFGVCSSYNSAGVACCVAGNGWTGSGQTCNHNYCWTVENDCCSISYPYACNGECYNYNKCGYSIPIIACY